MALEKTQDARRHWEKESSRRIYQPFESIPEYWNVPRVPPVTEQPSNERTETFDQSLKLPPVSISALQHYQPAAPIALESYFARRRLSPLMPHYKKKFTD